MLINLNNFKQRLERLGLLIYSKPLRKIEKNCFLSKINGSFFCWYLNIYLISWHLYEIFILNKTKFKFFWKKKIFFFYFFYWKKVPEILNFNVSSIAITTITNTSYDILKLNYFFFISLVFQIFLSCTNASQACGNCIKNALQQFRINLIYLSLGLGFKSIGFTLANATSYDLDLACWW